MTGFWYFLQIPSVTMTDSDPGEEGSAEESCAEQQNSEGDDDVQEVEAPASRASDKPILRLPERNDEDTDWTRTDGTKPASVKNKMPVEDMTIVRQRKELMRAAVAKNQVVDRWLRDQIKSERWERIATPFPHGNKHLPKQQCVLMTEDTKTPSPYRYQRYEPCVTSAAFPCQSKQQFRCRTRTRTTQADPLQGRKTGWS